MDDNKIVRVVEIDPDRLRKLEQDVSDMRTEGAVKKAEMGNLQKTMDRVVDAVFGNGKPGLKQQVPEVSAKVDGVQRAVDGIERTVNGLNEKGVFSTQKIKAISQDTVEKYNAAPGSFGEFRRTWLVPVVLMIISAIVGGVLGRFVFP